MFAPGIWRGRARSGLFGLVLATAAVFATDARAIEFGTLAALSSALKSGEGALVPVQPDLPPMLRSATFRTTPTLKTPLARRWAMARARIDQEMDWLATCESGACRDPRAVRWAAAVDLVRSAPEAQRPAMVHRMLTTGIRYLNDDAADDHWATPLFTLMRGGGDCEDHALLGRALLVSAGYAADSLFLLILRQPDGTGHVALQLGGKSTLILDNRFKRLVSQDQLSRDDLAAVAVEGGYFQVRARERLASL